MDNASNQKHQQLVLPCAGGSLEVSTAEAHTCQGREIIIRVYAIALNPFDKDQLETASAISRWPTVLGIEGAGVVESCGALVDGFNPGDEVLALFSIGEDNRSAAFQSHAVVDVSMVCHKPPDMSFADAASIPLAFVTALHTIRKGFHLPKTWAGTPLESSQDAAAASPRRFYIFGGNSPAGASAVQLLRHVCPEARIGATIYGEDKERLLQEAIRMVEIGVNYAIDGAAPETVEELRRTINNRPEIIFSFPHPSESDADVLSCLGGAEVVEADGLDLDMIAMTREDGALDLLGTLLRDEKYQIASPATVVGTGLEAVGAALKDLPWSGKHVVLLE